MLVMHLGSGNLRHLMLPGKQQDWLASWAWERTGPLGLPEGQTCSLDDRTAELSKLLAATQQQLEQAQVEV